MPTAGYSGTPLATKLGIKPGSRVHLIDAPRGFRARLAPLPAGVVFVTRLSKTTDVVHVFTMRKARLALLLETLRHEIPARCVGLGVLAEEGLACRDGRHRGRRARPGAADGAGRCEGVRG